MRLIRWVQLKGAGLLLCLAVAVPSWWLGGQMPLVGGPVFAILIGMLLASPVGRLPVFKQGIQFSAKKILQLVVVLLGFGLNLRVIASVGATSLPIIVSTILTALAVSALLRPRHGMPRTVPAPWCWTRPPLLS